MKVIAKVVSFNNETAQLSCPDSKGCGSCSAHGICGGAKDRSFNAYSPEITQLKKGDTVEVLLPTGKTIGAAFMVMIFPLILFFVFFIATKMLLKSPPDWLSVLAGTIGIAIGFIINFLKNLTQKKSSLPRIIKKI